MKITIQLSAEEVQKVIEGKINSEASKHGHLDSTKRKITCRVADGLGSTPLENLAIEVEAEIEVG